MPAEGGEAIQVTRGGGFYARESWDGGTLFYAKTISSTGLWQVPVEGGDEIEVLPEVIPVWYSWDISRSGIYYVSRVGRDFTLHYLDLATGEASDLLRRQGIASLETPSVSPDEEWVIYAEAPVGKAELVLVENFR